MFGPTLKCNPYNLKSIEDFLRITECLQGELQDGQIKTGLAELPNSVDDDEFERTTDIGNILREHNCDAMLIPEGFPNLPTGNRTLYSACQ